VKVGYIKLDEFSSHAAEQMKEAIEELSQQQVSGYVLICGATPAGYYLLVLISLVCG